MPRPNDKIRPYTLIRRLGRGGFGEVWLAERRGAFATTEVAIKLALDEDPDLNAIAQESQLWARLAGHPNVLPIIEADIYDGQVVIVSEYAPDGSLDAWLKRQGGAAPSIGRNRNGRRRNCRARLDKRQSSLSPKFRLRNSGSRTDFSL